MGVTTEHIAKVTGTDAFKAHGVHGVDLGASVVHQERCFVFFGDVVRETRPGIAHWSQPWRLASRGSAAATGLAAISRHGDNLDVFWTGHDGGIEVRSWEPAASWGHYVEPPRRPWQLVPASFEAAGGIASLAQYRDNVEVFWVGRNGDVGTRAWDRAWGLPALVAGRGSAGVPGLIACRSRRRGQLDVFWIGSRGEVVIRSWDGVWASPWLLAEPGSAAGDGGIVAMSRNRDHLDVIWVGAERQVLIRSWSWNQGWRAPWELAPPGSAALPSALAANSRHADNLDLFWTGPDGAINILSWNGQWEPRWSLTPPLSAAVPGNLTARSRHREHVDVFWIGKDGSVLLRSWNSSWGDPWPVAPPESAVAGGGLAAASRHPEHIDVFWVEPDGGIGARSWDGGGTLHDADAVAIADIDTSAARLSLNLVLDATTDNAVFAPLQIRKHSGFVLTPQTAQTPTGAFSHGEFAYVFWLVHDKAFDPVAPEAVTYLTRSARPSSGQPLDEVFRWGSNKFWQVAPVVVNNRSVPGLPPGDGPAVVLIAGGAADGGGDAVHLAWMPLRDRAPRLEDVQYYAGPGVPWSASADAADPLWRLAGGYTSISTQFVKDAGKGGLWVTVYARTDEDPMKQSVVARTALRPTGPWSDEITLFDPVRDGAYGRFMHVRGGDVLHPQQCLSWMPDETGRAYGAFILSKLTAWDGVAGTLALHYLMSTWCPYQVHHMKSVFTP